MKLYSKLLLTIVPIIIFIGSNNIATKKTYTAAVVTKVIQEVKHKSGNEDWQTTKPLTQLKTNDLLKTGQKSVAVLKYVDGSILRVRENSTIVILADKREKGLIKNTKIENGKLVFDVNKQSDDDKFIITTPTAVATIRGTSGLIEILDDGSTLLLLQTGSIELESLGLNRQTSVVEAGTSSLINPDGNIITNELTEQQKQSLSNAYKTNEKTIKVQTNRGNFKIYYLDSE